MRPSRVINLLHRLYGSPKKRPVILTGAPGVGKSDIFRQAVERAGIMLFDFRALLHDPSDLKFPLPDIENMMVHWINTLFPRDPEWRGIVLLEELDKCPMLMQGALLQLTLDRKVGDYTLPEGAWVCAAANRREDRAGGNAINTALKSRFTEICFEVSDDDWHNWAVQRGIHHHIRQFHKFKSGMLWAFDPNSTEHGQPLPRTWEFLSDEIDYIDPDDLYDVARGNVGSAAATEFTQYCRVYDQLPDPDLIIKNPRGATVPTEPDVLWAISGSLIERCRKAGDDVLEAVTAYSQRMPKMFMTKLVVDLQAAVPKWMNTPFGEKVLMANPKIFLANRN